MCIVERLVDCELRRVWVTDNGGVSGAAAGLELTELNWVHSTKTASLHTIAICIYTNKHKGGGENPNLADFLHTKDQESGEQIYILLGPPVFSSVPKVEPVS